MSDVRVNARFDEHTADNLMYLKGAISGTNTDILKEAVNFYADYIRNDVQRRKQALIDSGFIASFEGPEDMSVNYKRYIHEAIDAKYPPQKLNNS
ncbi:MAG: hypothetical protein V3V18_09290 [Methylococcales bacterium]